MPRPRQGWASEFPRAGGAGGQVVLRPAQPRRAGSCRSLAAPPAVLPKSEQTPALLGCGSRCPSLGAKGRGPRKQVPDEFSS